MSKKGKKRRTGNYSNYYKQCGRKQTYNTMDRARWAAQAVKKRRGKKCRPYKCPYCHKYHITSDT